MDPLWLLDQIVDETLTTIRAAPHPPLFCAGAEHALDLIRRTLDARWGPEPELVPDDGIDDQRLMQGVG